MLTGRSMGLLLAVGAAFSPARAGAQQVAEVQVAPASVTVAVNAKQGVFATVYDAKGNVLPTATITWSSSNVATVRAEPDPAAPGVCNLVGVAPGIATVEAKSGNQHGTVVVQVRGAGASAAPAGGGEPPAGAATVLKLDPGTVQLLPSEAEQVVPVFLRDDGSPGSGSSITWQSLQPAVASVNNTGMVVAIAPGQGLVQATAASGLVARVPVQVAQADFEFTRTALSLSPGTVDSVHAFVPSQHNRILAGAALQWRTVDERVARVSPLGVVTAVTPGKTQVVASGFFQEHSIPVVVHRPVEALDLLPPVRDPVTVPVGGAVKFQAKAVAADGTPVPEAVANFEVADTAFASFDPASGTATGKKIGTTRLLVHGPGHGLDTAWTLNVIAGGIAVDAPRVGLGIGGRRKVSASFTDGSGRSIAPASNLTWTATAPTVATVDPDGTIVGTGFGRGQVVVSTSWGKTDTIQVFVGGDVLVTSTRNGSPDIYTFDRGQPARMVQVTRDSAADVSASYSPDGTSITFVSTRDGNPEIYVMNADGTVPRRLTNTPGREDSPEFTPDGKHIVFASDRSGKMQVWIMGADGSDPKQLTQEPATNLWPAVSPDGQTIAFTSTRDGNYDIYLMGIDGSNQRNITKDPGAQTLPVWVNNGQLAYIVEQRVASGIDRIVMRKTLASGESTALTPGGYAVTQFAVSGNGDMLAIIVSTLDANGAASQKLYLVPVGAGIGTPLEVPRAGTEQYQSPSFKH